MDLTLTEKQAFRSKTAKPVLWLSMVSMVMLFAGLTSAYIVRLDQGNWLNFELPFQFYVSTGLILLSSVTMSTAQKAIKKGDTVRLSQFLALTLLLGIGFVISQFLGWGELVEQNVFFAGNQSNASGSFLYALTGLHLAHLVGGIIVLIVTLARSASNKYSANDYIGIQLASIYWHFLDILWIYLFLFLVFIR